MDACQRQNALRELQQKGTTNISQLVKHSGLAHHEESLTTHAHLHSMQALH